MMNLNRSISHALKASLLTAGLFLFTPTEAAAKTETFGVGNKTFSSLTASLSSSRPPKCIIPHPASLLGAAHQDVQSFWE